MEFSPPRRKALPGDNGTSDKQTFLYLIAFGERPSLSLGSCIVGEKATGKLTLVNDTELGRVVVLDKAGSHVQLCDALGAGLIPGTSSLCVLPRSSHALAVTWQPNSVGSMCETIRFCMTEGPRQVRLECRVQGSATAPPAAVRAQRSGSLNAAKTSSLHGGPGSITSTSGSLKLSTAAGKAPPRMLSLSRPAASAPPAASVAGPVAGKAAGDASMHAPVAAAVALQSPVNQKSLLPPPSKPPASTMSSPHLGAPIGGRAGPTTPVAFSLRGASPPAKVPRADGGARLDFRRVGNTESKRERDLVSWMNSEVAPLAGDGSAQAAGLEGHALRRLLGEVSGRAYMHFKRDEGFAALASKVELKIASRQLAIKDPENTLNDVRMRQQAMEVLACYHPFWLAVGMQTVLGCSLVRSQGQMLSLMRTLGEVPGFLRAFAAERLLADPDLTQEYRLAPNKQEYYEALGAKVLGRLLLLVLLLDHLAEQGGLPATSPALFRQDARIKSSEQVLTELLQPRLAGVGDVRHTLRMMGVTAGYVQHVRDEADYRVTKPADLRDGTRLAKLLDCLKRNSRSAQGSAPPPLSSQPSIASLASASTSATGLASAAAGGVGPTCTSRIPSLWEDLLPTMAFPQHTGKPLDESAMRNNCIRLARALQQHGVNLAALAPGSGAGPREVGADGAAKAVADGLVRLDQRTTLGLLWQMAMHFKLRHHVDTRGLEREAGRLRRAAATAAMIAAAQHGSLDAAPPGGAASSLEEADDAVLLRYFNDTAAQALLQWVRAACAPHGVAVDNLTWSLADGRALCYLVHTYLPEALPLDAVYTPTTPTSADEMAAATGGAEYVKLETLKRHGWSAVYEMGGAIHDEPLAAAHKRGVAANFAALHAAGAALGVAPMLSPEDYLQDGPDELSALLYVALLAQALLRLTAEKRAALTIVDCLRRRMMWRPARMHACLERFKRVLLRERAAVAIQAYWRMTKFRTRFHDLRRAACVVQAAVRCRLARLELSRRQQAVGRATQAAVALQAAWRAVSARRQLQRLRRAALVLQAAWRGWQARLRLAQRHAAATVIQAHVRGHLQRKKRALSMMLERQRAAATTIQAWWRGCVQRQKHLQLQRAVVAIQAAVRMRADRLRYLRAQQAAVTVQAAVRKHQAQQRYLRVLQAVVRIQAHWRRLAAQRQAAARKAAATQLQAAARCHLARKALARAKAAACRIQAAWRAIQAQRMAEQLRAQRQRAVEHRAAALLQAVVRGHWARQQLVRQHQAATAIQACWRGVLARRRFLQTRHAAVRVQAAFRCYTAQQAFQRQRTAAITIQSHWRRAAAMQTLAAAQGAATTIQAAWRLHTARQRFLRLRMSVIALQAAARMRAARGRFVQQRRAAIAIQAAWKAHMVRQELVRQRSAAVHIQAYWRMELAQRGYRERMAAVVAVQAGVRGWLVRRDYLRAREAAMAVQLMWRGRVAAAELARRADAYYSRLRQQQAELLLEISRQFMRKVAAAIKIQAWWRGLTARRDFGPVWAAHCATRNERNAAIVLQTAFRAYSARKRYLRMRAASTTLCCVLLPLWRARRERRRLQARHDLEVRSAVAIQTAFRAWLARRELLTAVRAATKIQAAWRGHAVRKSDGRAKQEARWRLGVAQREAARAPHKHIGNRAREALELVLRSNKPLVQVMAAVECLETATRYSRACCELIALSGGVGALLRFVRSCNRSKPHVDLLNRALQILHNICRYRALMPHVLHAEDCLIILSERLQFFRDTEEVFHPTCTLLRRLAEPEELAAEMAGCPNVLRHWDGILQLLARKADLERKYLDRLEGQKGSDVSARESTRKLLIVQQQVAALSALIQRVEGAGEAAGTTAQGAMEGPLNASVEGLLGDVSDAAGPPAGSCVSPDTAAGHERDQDVCRKLQQQAAAAAQGASPKGSPVAKAIAATSRIGSGSAVGIVGAGRALAASTAGPVAPAPGPPPVAVPLPAYKNTLVKEVAQRMVAGGAVAVVPVPPKKHVVGGAGSPGQGRLPVRPGFGSSTVSKRA